MITGRSPENKALNEMINYLNEVQKIHLENNKSLSLDQIKLDQKVYTSMVLLIYNLDETSQKS
jgi:hypothetical protein